MQKLVNFVLKRCVLINTFNAVTQTSCCIGLLLQQFAYVQTSLLYIYKIFSRTCIWCIVFLINHAHKFVLKITVKFYTELLHCVTCNAKNVFLSSIQTLQSFVGCHAINSLLQGLSPLQTPQNPSMYFSTSAIFHSQPLYTNVCENDFFKFCFNME